MSDAQVVYVITPAGKIHKGALVDDEVKVGEECNLDDVLGKRTVATELPESASDETCCDRCFPEPVA